MRYAMTAVLAFLVFTVAPLSAAPIVLTGGTIIDRSDQDVSFELQSATHTLSCTFTCGSLVWLPDAAVSQGTTLDVSGRVLFNGHGTITVNGVQYHDPSGTWNFAVGSVVVPSGPQPNIGFFQPFTMTGNLTAENALGQLALDLSLSGEGRAGMNFSNEGWPVGVRDLNSLIFTFTEPGVGGGNGGPVIPEPSTVLLVASGLAGLGLWRRRSAA